MARGACIASCAAAGACGTQFGDLVAKFTTGVAALNDAPVTVSTQFGSLDVDGYTYAYLLFRMMYARSTYASMPLVINDLATRRVDRIGSTLATWLDSGSAGIAS